MDTGLNGRVVLVTGASGGIGNAVARAFAAEGARLALHYHRGRDRVRALAEELSSSGAEVWTGAADLTREAAVERLYARVLRRFGRVDVLVGNAGSWENRDVLMHEMTLRQWRWTMDAVLTSMFLSVRGFLRVVERQGAGCAVLVGSTAAVFGEAGHADYAAAKSAISFGLVRTLKNELGRLAPHTAAYCGGRINCVCPGWTVVPRNRGKLADASVVRRVTATMALPQIGRPEDVANAVVYLASDRLSRHVTGQTLVVAGGMEGRWLWRPEEVDPGLV